MWERRRKGMIRWQGRENLREERKIKVREN
jgi:hypothetical protein